MPVLTPGVALKQLLSVEVMHLDGSASVSLVGEFDHTGVDLFHQVVRPLVKRYDPDQVLFDCTGLEFIDSAGVAQLVAVARALGGDGKAILRGCSCLMVKLLSILGVDNLFRIEEAANSATAT